MTNRRGSGRDYTPTHAHLGHGKSLWQGICGRCNAKITTGKQHKLFGQVCREGCKR